MILVEAVRKRFGPVVAVDGLSFEVRRGEVVGLLGPNGAGKTTTMKMLTGTLQPDEGTVQFDGAPISADLTAAKRRVGYLPEANPLYDDMIVSEHLAYVCDLHGLSGPETRSGVADAVEETGIGDVFYRPVGELSKGFRQRVGLAAAILHGPEILVLDEPTEGLDPNQRVDIRRLVVDLGRERTILLSTHVMQEVEATCSRLLILNRGRLAADGSVQDLLARRTGAAQYVVEVEGEGAEAVAALVDLDGVLGHSAEAVDGRVRVTLEVSGEHELRPTIFSLAKERGWTLWELHRERVSLEQVFHDLTQESGEGAAEKEAAA
ncbi:MAG: ATP-binding cassette domain-containing protein [Gammaproteobacteria bacterium]|nr:ATP-binding cassette domain-containing protein [Gammaproteobacteria bacterium]